MNPCLYVCACMHVYMYRYVYIHMWEVDLGSEVLGRAEAECGKRD